MMFVKSTRNIRSKPEKIRALALFIGILALIYFRKILYLRYYYSVFYIDTDAIIQSHLRDFTPYQIDYRSKCTCRQNETVYLRKMTTEYRIAVKRRRNDGLAEDTVRSYSVERAEFENSVFTCDLFNELRRGPNQRVISYSLYGQNRNYYNYIRDLVLVVRKKYPNWTVRIHYDSSIFPEFICEIECMTYVDEASGHEVFIDIVDFCDIERVPYDTTKSFNASYMHGILLLYCTIIYKVYLK